ncbi:MAG: type II secretion system protein GspE, partial [Lachnospiraceae bacterium]|nr:type II secretion system protein GspE [Lachnospiraceae bacterium]
MDFGRKKIRLGELLINSGLITKEQLEAALLKQRSTGKKLGEFLIDENIVTEEQLMQALSKQLNLEMVDLQAQHVNNNVLKLVPVNVLKKNVVFPFDFVEGNINTLRVAMSDPLDIYAQDDIAIVTNYQIQPVVATTRSIMLAINKYYGQEELTSTLEAYAKEKNLSTVEENMIEEEISDSPIVMLVKEMIDNAVRQRASDIHIEPMESYIRVRYRIDGALYDRSKYAVNVLSAIIARIKIIGGMDISE